MRNRLDSPRFAVSVDAGLSRRVRLPLDAQSGPDGQDAAGRAQSPRIDQDQPADVRDRAPGCAADRCREGRSQASLSHPASGYVADLRAGDLPDQNIAGSYPVEADGTITLGPAYGSIKVSDLTLSEAKDAIVEHLKNILTAPEVSVSLAESAGQQQIEGEHLVGPDGTVNLGTYGSVFVAGMTLSEAREAVEKHLTEFLDEPEVSVDVFAYNSKFYYVVTEGAGLGDQIQRVPITGNETVLDAITQIGGLAARFQQDHLDRPPGPGRWQWLPGAAGQLAGHHRCGRYLDQLAGHARRPRLRGRGQANRPG